MSSANREISELIKQKYDAGFVTDIEADTVAPGLNEDIIRTISEKKQEPEFMLAWRLKAYRHWVKMVEPTPADNAPGRTQKPPIVTKVSFFIEQLLMAGGHSASSALRHIPTLHADCILQRLRIAEHSLPAHSAHPILRQPAGP